MILEDRPRFGFLIVASLILLFGYVALRSTTGAHDAGLLERLLDLLTKPAASKGSLKDVFGPVDVWFRNVSGISLTQLMMAIWRVVVWVLSWVISLVWRIAGSIQGLVKG